MSRTRPTGSNNRSDGSTEHVAVSRLLSKILRHKPEMIGICLDSQGWVSVDELIRRNL
ncbi:RNA 2'-phosphotransferase [Paraburkholderia sp. GAS333]|uniref:RNA 2'-phosphotransferase n=1 Tax=Paraburkholderia sp. GAS333 TaxID=3156279 RepID=UPI003D251386